MNSPEYITIDGVSKVYTVDRRAAVAAVCEVDLKVNPGDFIVITGRSGSGKTTLLNIMAGLTTPTAGRVLYEGIEVWKLPDTQQSRFRNQHIGFVFQFPSLMPSLTVLENVLLPTRFFSNAEDAGTRAGRATDLLREVGLADKMGSYPRELSAGEQQRVVISRSLINQPRFMFADEPTSDLDEQTEHEIMELFEDIHRRLGVTVVLVTHSSELTRYGTRAFHMTAGRLVERPRVDAATLSPRITFTPPVVLSS